MSKREKREFVLNNLFLPLEELSSQTGLSPRQVRKIIEKSKAGDTLSAAGSVLEQSWPRYGWLLALAVLLTFLAYLPSLDNHLVNWDDLGYIQNNLHIRSLAFPSIQWMFSHFLNGFYMPLTWLSLASDYRLGGLNPRVYHLDNLVLHCLNTALVFLLSFRILTLVRKNGILEREGWRGEWTLSGAFLTAILFGLHPIHVESVAWATERKDVLFGFFYLLVLLFYLDYASSHSRKAWKLTASLGLFLLALMSKPMAVTLPLVLLLLDAWPLGRFSRDRAKVFMEKIPFFIASLLGAWLTILSQSKAEALLAAQVLPVPARVLNAFHSLAFYVEKMIFPAGLAAFYPITEKTKVVSLEYLSCIVLVFSWFGLCIYWRKKRPYLMAGSLYYLLTLAPVLGLFQSGSQTAADRFAYLPSLGPFLLFSSLVAFFFSNRRWVFILLAAGLAVSLGYRTLRQCATWKDSITLWENAVKVCPDVSVITYSELGNAYQDAGRLDDAIRAYDQAIALDPLPSAPYDSKGTCLYTKGFVEEAAKLFQAAIGKEPRNAIPHSNLSKAYQQMGKYEEALAEAGKAVQFDPGLASAYNNLGASYWYLKQPGKSFEAYQKAISLDPDNQSYLINLANLYAQGGKYDEAVGLYQQGIAVNPRKMIYYLNLGYIYFQTGKYQNAVDLLQRAADLQPGNPGIYQKLGLTYEKMGQGGLAAESFAKAKALAEAKGR